MRKMEKRDSKEFESITYDEFYKLYFGEKISDNPLSLRKIAKLYGVTLESVKAKKKELGITWLNCAVKYVTRRGSR